MNYVKFTEYNDHEGETWHFYLQLDGNADQLTQFKMFLDVASGDDPDGEFPYKLDLEPISQSEVDTLISHSDDDGYMPSHNRVTGTFTCPAEPFDPDDLYKGDIVKYFTEAPSD